MTKFNSLNNSHKSAWIRSLTIIYQASREQMLLALTEIDPNCIVYNNMQSSAWYDDNEHKRVKEILSKRFTRKI